MSEAGRTKADLDTPALWVDLDTLERNIAELARHFAAAGVQWRPHMKGIRVPAIARKAIAAGAIGVTCATMREAEAMADGGVGDILIANQMVGQRKISRLTRLCQRADVKVIVDNADNVRELDAAARCHGLRIGVLIDVDCGMNRTGLLPGPPVLELAHAVERSDGLRFLGLMAWEGHTLALADPDERVLATRDAIARLVAMAEACRAAGLQAPIVSGGGSGTYKTTPFIKGMTEIQAGGAIFCDVIYQRWGVETTPCLFVQTIVSSRPAPDRIVVDAGFKTLPIWHAQPRGIGLPAVKSHASSAEHGVITLERADTRIKVGDLLDFIVGYTDSAIILHRKLYGIRQGVVEVEWDLI
ncbi:MAG: DSD1 family PLP-dependent enzyme [Chloroflexi bacterium]|nr:DSD1 family PLP-dependent enzyme [Chloroflexota bacterium]